MLQLMRLRLRGLESELGGSITGVLLLVNVMSPSLLVELVLVVTGAEEGVPVRK
jgi:hypothetical protein